MISHTLFFSSLRLPLLRMSNATLPAKVESLLRKSKRPVKFVLFRVPKDVELKDLEGSELDLTDLKLTSIGSDLEAVPDLLTNPDRASACPLLPNTDETLKCGRSFDATIQIVKRPQAVDVNQSNMRKPEKIKEEKAKKSKRVKVQLESDQE